LGQVASVVLCEQADRSHRYYAKHSSRYADYQAYDSNERPFSDHFLKPSQRIVNRGKLGQYRSCGQQGCCEVLPECFEDWQNHHTRMEDHPHFTAGGDCQY